jgi:hypothetical protein
LGIDRFPRKDTLTFKKLQEYDQERWLGRGLPYFQEGPRTKVLIATEDIRTFLTRRQGPKSSLDVMVEAVVKELQPSKREQSE